MVCACVQVRKYVMEEVNKAGKAKKLRGFEMIKSVLLDEEAWSGAQLHGQQCTLSFCYWTACTS